MKRWLLESAFIGMSPPIIRTLMKIQLQHREPGKDTLNGVVIQPGKNALRVM